MAFGEVYGGVQSGDTELEKQDQDDIDRAHLQLQKEIQENAEQKLASFENVSFVGHPLPDGVAWTFDKTTQILNFGNDTILNLSAFPATGPIPDKVLYIQSQQEGATCRLRFMRMTTAGTTNLTITVERILPVLKSEIGTRSAPGRGIEIQPDTVARYKPAKIIPFKETGPNTPPQKLPQQGFDFAEVGLHGQQKDHYFLVKEMVNGKLQPVSYKIRVRNERGVLRYSVTKEAEKIQIDASTIAFPPERQLYVTKAFEGGAELQGSVLQIKDIQGNLLRSVDIAAYPSLKIQGTKMTFERSFEREQTNRRVTLEMTANGLVGSTEEFVPLDAKVARIGNSLYNKLTAFKTEFTADGTALRLKNIRTNMYLRSGVNELRIPLQTADFARNTSANGRQVATNIMIGGIPYNLYIQKVNGVAQLAAESLDVPGDAEFSIVSALQAGARVPGVRYIKPITQAEFLHPEDKNKSNYALTVGIRLPGPAATDGTRPTIEQSVQVQFSRDEIFSRPGGNNAPGGLNFPNASVEKKVIVDGVTYTITFRNQNGEIRGRVINSTPVVEKKPELVPEDNKDPSYMFDTALKDPDVFGGKEIMGYYKKLESSYKLDADQQERFDRLTMGRDRLRSVAGTQTNFDIYRDDRLDPRSANNPLELGIDDSLIGFDINDFTDPEEGRKETRDKDGFVGYRKSVQAEDYFSKYHNEERELEVKLVPRMVTYEEPLDALDPERIHNGKTTRTVKKQEGYMLRSRLRIPVTSEFWKEERVIGDVLPDFSVLLTPVEIAKRKIGEFIDKVGGWIPGWPRWESGADRGECIEPNTGLSRSELLSIGLQWPVPGQKAGAGSGSDYGERRGGDFHGGIDIPGRGKTVKSAFSGTLLKIQTGQTSQSGTGSGNYVQILHEATVGGKKIYFTTIYCHLGKTGVSGIKPEIESMKPGEFIPAGVELGEIGNTGHVVANKGGDGSHLHFGIHLTDEKGNRVSGGEPDYTINPCYFYPQEVSGIPDHTWGCFAEGESASSAAGVIENLKNAAADGKRKEFKKEFYESNIETAIGMYRRFQDDETVDAEYKDVVVRDDMLAIFLNETGMGRDSEHDDGRFQCTDVVYQDIKSRKTHYPLKFLLKYAADNGDINTIEPATCKTGERSVAVALARMAHSAYDPLQTSGGFDAYLKGKEFKQDMLTVDDVMKGKDPKYSIPAMEKEVTNKALKFSEDALLALVTRVKSDTNLQKRFVVIRRYNIPYTMTSPQAVYYALKVLYYSEYAMKGVEGVNKKSPDNNDDENGNKTPEKPKTYGPFSSEEVDKIIGDTNTSVIFNAVNGGPRDIKGQKINRYVPQLKKGSLFSGTVPTEKADIWLGWKDKDAYLISSSKEVIKIDRSRFEANSKNTGGRTKAADALTIGGKKVSLTYRINTSGATKEIEMAISGSGGSNNNNGSANEGIDEGRTTAPDGGTKTPETKNTSEPFSSQELDKIIGNTRASVMFDRRNGGPRDIKGQKINRYVPQLKKGNLLVSGTSPTEKADIRLGRKGNDAYIISSSKEVVKIDRSKFTANKENTGGQAGTDAFTIGGKKAWLTYRINSNGAIKEIEMAVGIT